MYKEIILKRSITISGHSTSIFIEDEFWQALKEIATEKEISVPALIGEIDMSSINSENTTNLSSRIRVYILQYYKKV
ncbi:MAG: ribbon-helix-helix domain-containing protein [Alphaproteobacteria bacterium]|nr:ribbon-helix-helix domain-containing protein [Alphaproteobacteria bacterium]